MATLGNLQDQDLGHLGLHLLLMLLAVLKKKRKKAHLHFNTVELKGLAHRMVFNRQVYSQALKLLQMVTQYMVTKK